MLVEEKLIPAADRPVRIPFRAVLDGFPGHVQINFSVSPTHALNPLRSDQNSFARPPIPRVNNCIANLPAFILEEEVLDMPDLAV